MTQSQAERTANVVMVAAAIGAAYYVLKTPPLRRLAWRLTAVALTGFIPAWLNQEIRASWDASAAPAAAAQPSRATEAV